jgi:S1-C subfamily serine protease
MSAHDARRRMQVSRRLLVVVVATALLPTACTSSQTVTGAGSVRTLTPNAVFRLAAPATLQVYGPVATMMGGSGLYAFGSGVLIDKSRGFAITNAHVIDGVSNVSVRFNDGTQSTAEVAGRSPCDDLAVLHIDHSPPAATAISFGDSNTVQPGDSVSVLGYPASLASIRSESVVFTQGLVQSVHVRVDQFADLPVYADTIQHSATINHGNSGGPLVDDRGERAEPEIAGRHAAGCASTIRNWPCTGRRARSLPHCI